MPDLHSVDSHLAAVLGLVRALPQVSMPIDDALGLALAEPVVAPVALPGFDNSSMDGYVVTASDVAVLPVALPVAEDIPAGRGDAPPLRPGTADRIMTGAPIPDGGEVIVPVEWTDGAAVGSVRIDRAPAAGRFIRRRGEDVRPGEHVLAQGDELTAPRLGLLAALGIDTAPVRRRPVVSVVATGSELVPPGHPLGAGQLYESNSTLLAAELRAAGAEVRRSPMVTDEPERCLRSLRAAAEGADLVLTTGGISAGAYEVVKLALSRLGTVEFVRVAMQPGKPQGYGTIDGTPVLTLPGNPVSSFVSFHVFVRPVLRTMLGLSAVQHEVHTGRLVERMSTPGGMRVFRRGRYDAASGAVELVGGAGSHLVGSLARSNCLVVASEQSEEVGVGSPVPLWLVG